MILNVLSRRSSLQDYPPLCASSLSTSEPGRVSPPAPWRFAGETQPQGSHFLSSEWGALQIKPQQAVSKVLITCFSTSMYASLHRKISQQSLGHLQLPYRANRWFGLFYNKGTHFGTYCFKLLASSYYLFFFFFPSACESNLPLLARSVLPAPSPGLIHRCWHQEVTKGFATAQTPRKVLCKVACHVAGSAK